MYDMYAWYTSMKQLFIQFELSYTWNTINNKEELIIKKIIFLYMVKKI